MNEQQNEQKKKYQKFDNDLYNLVQNYLDNGGLVVNVVFTLEWQKNCLLNQMREDKLKKTSRN